LKMPKNRMKKKRGKKKVAEGVNYSTPSENKSHFPTEGDGKEGGGSKSVTYGR